MLDQLDHQVQRASQDHQDLLDHLVHKGRKGQQGQWENWALLAHLEIQDLKEHQEYKVLLVTVALLDNQDRLDFQGNQVTQDQLEILVQLLLQDSQVIQVPVDPSGSLDHQDLLVLLDLVGLQETMANRVILDFLDQEDSQVLLEI